MSETRGIIIGAILGSLIAGIFSVITTNNVSKTTIGAVNKQYELNNKQRLIETKEGSYAKMMGYKKYLYFICYDIVRIYTDAKYYEGMYYRYRQNDDFIKTRELEKEQRDEMKTYGSVIKEISETFAQIRLSYDMNDEINNAMDEINKIENSFYKIQDPILGSDRTDLIEWQKNQLDQADSVIKQVIISKIDKLIVAMEKQL